MGVYGNGMVDWPSLKKVTFFNEGKGGGVSSMREVSKPSPAVSGRGPDFHSQSNGKVDRKHMCGVLM